MRKLVHWGAVGLVLLYLLIALSPIYWVVVTSFKTTVEAKEVIPTFYPSASAVDLADEPPPKPGEIGRQRPYGFKPTLDNYRGIFFKTDYHWKSEHGTKKITDRRVPPNEFMKWELVEERHHAEPFGSRLLNSVIIAGISTFLAVLLGTFAAYGFSRFPLAGAKDWLFFILSTRMLPPVVVAIPIFLMFSQIGLRDSHLGLIILYTVFNLSFAVWLMKGFMDEIPKEYEEAAVVDGYTRLQAFRKVVLPQAWTGIAATAVFCLIAAWNEFAFAMILTQDVAETVPVYVSKYKGGSRGIEYGKMAASSLLFMLPVMIFTFIMRNHLLRGITFGAIKK